MFSWFGNISWSVLIVGFLIFNITSGIILAKKNHRRLLLTRLLVSEILFLIMAVLLSLSILVTYTTRYGRALSEIQVYYNNNGALCNVLLAECVEEDMGCDNSTSSKPLIHITMYLQHCSSGP